MSKLLKSKKKKLIKNNFQSKCALSKICSIYLKFRQYSFFYDVITEFHLVFVKNRNLMKKKTSIFRPPYSEAKVRCGQRVFAHANYFWNFR